MKYRIWLQQAGFFGHKHSESQWSSEPKSNMLLNPQPKMGEFKPGGLKQPVLNIF